jgi:mycothione reductase
MKRSSGPKKGSGTMNTYDLIAVGSGSATNVLDSMLQRDPAIKIALIDKDEPGGICLTRGCIPSKMLLYPAELLRTVAKASPLGIEVEVRKVDFLRVMERMRTSIARDIAEIRKGLTGHPNIDYYPEAAEFIAPYTMKVGGKIIKADAIFLGTGSKPLIPPVKGLAEAGFLTSDSLLKLTELPERIAILGGGYIAAEYGHFFSAMGSEVTIIGRNFQFLPEEEPEVSALAKREMSRYMTILTGHEVREVKGAGEEKVEVVAFDRERGAEVRLAAEKILVAAGRAPNTDILHPERGGIRTDKKGWIEVNEYLETSQRNIWALGDATGKYPFKHKANYESRLIYFNAVLGRKIRADYHAVPHAVFSYPEIASVGLKEKDALAKYGEKGILIGLQRFEDTGKGEAMGLKDFFAKVILQEGQDKILGAHIVGPQASILIQEVVTQMYTPEQNSRPIAEGMHIHPALSEVVERAFQSLMPPAHYHHVLRDSLDLNLP